MKNFLLIASCILLLANCFNEAPKKEVASESTKTNYLEEGKKIATQTFATLGGNLQKAMKEGGVTNAAKYCNVAASPLVDSLEQVYHAEIKRTALKLRNPKNQPTKEELVQLQNYQQQFAAGKELKPIVQKTAAGNTFFAPIHVMPLCEKCHGKIGDTLKEADYASIKSLYPEDMAIGYKTGDLRGMWSISFLEK